MARAPKDSPKDKEIKRLLEENLQLEGDIKRASLEAPLKVINDRDRLAAEVEELRKFKSDADAFRAKVEPKLLDLIHAEGKLDALECDTVMLTHGLEVACTVLSASGDGSPRHGTSQALIAAIGFLAKRGLDQRLLIPLRQLIIAQGDAEAGVTNIHTAPGGKEGRDSINKFLLITSASFAVSRLEILGTPKKKAYGEVIEASGIPMGKLGDYRNKLNKPKTTIARGARELYKKLEKNWNKLKDRGASKSELEEHVESLLNQLRHMRDTSPK